MSVRSPLSDYSIYHPDALQNVLDRLKNVRGTGYGSGYMARCPAHDDQTNSLKVSRADDGRVLLYCHAGCQTEDVVQALGLKMSDLFDHQADHLYGRQNGSNEKNGKNNTGKQYDYRYVDADGELVAIKRRIDYADGGKSFVWYTPQGYARGEMGLKGIPLSSIPLYGLTGLLDASVDEPVLLVEGEKACEALHAKGFVAVSLPGGAGQKDFGDTLMPLTGRTVILWPDNDDKGKALMQQVALALHGRVKELHWLEPAGSDVQPKDDAYDYFARGGTVDNVKAMIEQAPIPDVSSFSRFPDIEKQENEKNKQFSLTALPDLLAEPEQEIDYLVEGLLPSGGVSLVAAKPKVGKSTIARELCLDVGRGEDFLGRLTKQGAVVYLALEEKRSGVASHFRSMGGTDEPIYIHVGSAPAAAMQALKGAIEEHKPLLEVVDPIHKLIRVKDLNDYAEVSQAMEPIIDLARNSGCHIMCLHHLNKAERMGGDAGDSILGSTALLAAVDNALIMKRRSETRTLETIQRYGTDMPETVVAMDRETGRISLGVEFDALQLQEVEAEVLKAIGSDTLKEVDIRNRVGGNSGLCGKAIRKLLEDGKLTRTGTGRRNDPYMYSLSNGSGVCVE